MPAYGGGVASAVPYLGLACTRINIPSFVNATYQQLNFRRWFSARSVVASLQIALPNWYANNTVSEAGSGGTATFTAAIERLDGSIQQFQWGGAAQSPSVADGAQTALTDALVLTTPLKRGEWFAVRGFGQFSTAIVLNSLTTSASTGQGDALEFAASGLTDKSLSGTIGTQSANTFGPCLVVANIREATCALYGDSRVKGGASSPGVDTADGSGDLGELARSIGTTLAYLNMGTASETLQAFLANNSRRLALGAYASHIICGYGINDITGGRSQDLLLADMATFCALSVFAGKPVVWSTIGPKTTSSDAWITLANQTVFAQESVRVGVNGMLRARKVAGLTDVFDTSKGYESGPDSGKYAIGNGGQALTADGLHLTALGLQQLPLSGQIDPRRLTRP